MSAEWHRLARIKDELAARAAKVQTAIYETERQTRELLAAREKAMRESEDYAASYAKGDGMFERYAEGDADRCKLIWTGIANLFPCADYERGHPDYSALPYELRVATLGAFLGIRPERESFPRLVLGNSDLAGLRYVFRHFDGPADIGVWRKHLPTIRRYLGAEFDWTVELTDATHVTLVCHEPLPPELPIEPEWLSSGELFLGIDPITREPVHQSLADLTHTYVVGSSGSGKTNALYLLLASVLHNQHVCDDIFLVDGKDGVALSRFAGAAKNVHVLWEPEDFASLLGRLVTLMTERNAAQRAAGIDNATSGFVFVVIDELATYVQPPPSDNPAEKKRHKELIANLIRIAQRGRSVGIRLVVTVQEPQEDSLPTRIRSNLNSVLAFRLPINQHITTVFGGLEGLPAHPGDLKRGVAIFRNSLAGTQRLLQLPVMPRPAPNLPKERV